MPEAEPAVDLLRRAHTRDGAKGMPPHVTLLHPFTDTARLVAGRVREVREVFEPFGQFDFELSATGWFRAAEDVLWLAPTPAEPFVAMTEALVRRFPEHPPYGGEVAEIVPHLTVAVGADARLLQQIERAVAPALPIRARASSVSIMQHVDDAWRLHTQIDLRI